MIISFRLAPPIGSVALPVSIECSIDATKPPSFHVDGVSATQAKEIAVRVRSAISATDLCVWPAGRVTISIDAKGAKLVTSALDLPIALTIAGIDVGDLLVAGELGLDGSVRPVRGVLQAALLVETLGLAGVLVPAKSAREALEVGGDVIVRSIAHLSEIKVALSERAQLAPRTDRSRDIALLDFTDVRGQPEAIAKVEQSVQTRAGLLLSGSPGAGKTMIARRIPSLLPQMSRDERIEVTRVYSAIGLSDGLVIDRPFRAPHHTISAAALVGGGTSARPGEVHLAVRGVLLLDEICEFPRGTIEALAQALAQMPEASRPLVVASANPCPCGYRDSGVRMCCCTTEAVARHTTRVEWAVAKLGLSIRAQVQPITVSDLRGPAGETSASIAKRISAARQGN